LRGWEFGNLNTRTTVYALKRWPSKE
jgi:hypothetical protein